jgi:hypothetical protein
VTNESAPSSIQVRGFQAAVHAAATAGSGQRELVDCVVESEDALAVQRRPTPAPAIRAGVRTFLRPVVAPPLRLAGGRLLVTPSQPATLPHHVAGWTVAGRRRAGRDRGGAG